MAAPRTSGPGRLLQPVEFGGSGLTAGDFICAVYELGAVDGSRGWLAAMVNSAARYLADSPEQVQRQVWGADPDALTTVSHSGSGRVADGRVTGRWQAVGAEQAQWLLLSALDSDAIVRRVLVSCREVRTEPVAPRGGLGAAGVCDVAADSAPVRHVLADGRQYPAVIAAAAAAAAVVGSADGVWRTHVEQVRGRLAISHGGGEVTDESAAELARSASDIDIAKLAITSALEPQEADLTSVTGASAQAVALACRAADRLLGSSRHALDASDAVTRLWRDVHAGSRLAAALLDDLVPAPFWDR
jgi:3-hydroxy-9,10-secoandrosta-1,3,5(10)-triene-9,17-dione monooxygenase